MTFTQSNISAELAPYSQYLTFNLHSDVEIQHAKLALLEVDCSKIVIGIGTHLLTRLNIQIEGMREMPIFELNGQQLPNTEHDLWCWICGEDPGEVHHLTRQLLKTFETIYSLTTMQTAFKFDGGRDLTGYEDGTENPQDEEAQRVAFCQSDSAIINNSSFVAVQKWQHDFAKFDTYSPEQQDDMIGRHRVSNIEFDSAPDNAHVKLTAQESFEPEAFVLRRSMPWVNGLDSGLMFVAFACSFTPFEAQFNRMIGKEDGLTDQLFNFTQPIDGAYYWCPALDGKRLYLG